MVVEILKQGVMTLKENKNNKPKNEEEAKKQLTVNKQKQYGMRSLIAFVLAFVLLIGSSMAYFSDYATTQVTGTAGTLKIHLDDSGVNLLNAKGQNILNPGDMRDVIFTVTNQGNKSADIKTVITLISSVEMSNNHTALKNLPVYDFVHEGLYEGEVYFSEYELYYKDNLIHTDGYGYYPKENTQGLGQRAYDTLGRKKIVYVLEDDVLSGSSTYEEREIEYSSDGVAISDAKTYELALLFDPHTLNEFQGSTVTILIEVWAKQHRNTESVDWVKMQEYAYSSLPDSMFNIDYNRFHELEITSIADMDKFNSTKDIVIPEGVQLVPDQFFFFNSTMETVTLPSTLKRTGITAFAWCANLKSAYFEDGLITLGDATFSNCAKMTSVRLPDTLQVIGSSAFYRCSGLTSIEIPEGVTTILNSAFADSGLIEVSIPESVTVIEAGAFKNCSNLESVILPSHMTEIPDDIFTNCPNLKSITIRG